MKAEGTTNARGARRRRIVERGSDRFALITGRIQTLDNDKTNDNHDRSSTHHSYTKSSPDFFSKNHHAEGEKGVVDGGNAVANGVKVEPQLRKCETNTEAIRGAYAADFGNEVQLSPAFSKVPKASDDSKKPLLKAKGGGFYLFTPKEISSSIVASENMRVFCSVVIAVLVVLSYVKSESFIVSEPLYILLMTDFSIVIGQLILEKRRGSEKAKEEVKDMQEDGHNWEGAATVLELGLLVHQALRAIFIDCCFYVVIVVCSFSVIYLWF